MSADYGASPYSNEFEDQKHKGETGPPKLPCYGRLAAIRPSLKARAQELKLLMDHAEQSTGGPVVNVIAYKADYVTATEQLKVLDATAGDKKCAIPADQ